MKSTLSEQRLVFGYRISKNIGQHLFQSKFDMCDRNISGLKKCSDKRCKACDHIEEITEYSFRNGTSFTIRSNMNCDTTGFIYALICDKCKKEYIGQSGDRLINRTRVHRQQIMNSAYRSLEVSKHVWRCSKTSRKFIDYSN